MTSGLSETITSVEADYADANKVWVTVGGWARGTKLFYSSNGGSSWTNITKNLPNFPANIIKQEVGNSNDALYIGLDIGIYYTDNTLNTWVPYMQDLPNSSVRDLEINEKENLIRAATYGRGVWESNLYSGPNSINTAFSSQNWSTIYPNPTNGTFNIQLKKQAINEYVAVSVFNLLGKKVYAIQLPATENNLPVTISTLPSGVYILKLKLGNEEWHGRIIKQ
jgi:Secretion system C-terminal sorting domain